MADIALRCRLGTSSICCFDNGVTTRVCCSIAASHSICSARLLLPPSCQLAALPVIFLFIWQPLFLRRSRSRLEPSLTSFHPQLFISSLVVFQFCFLILLVLTLPPAGGRVLLRKKSIHTVSVVNSWLSSVAGFVTVGLWAIHHPPIGFTTFPHRVSKGADLLWWISVWTLSFFQSRAPEHQGDKCCSECPTLVCSVWWLNLKGAPLWPFPAVIISFWCQKIPNLPSQNKRWVWDVKIQTANFSSVTRKKPARLQNVQVVFFSVSLYSWC